MIDIHSHVLPKIDDGPQSWQETMAMLYQAQEDGISEIAITHHILSNLGYEKEDEIILKYNELQDRIKNENLKLKVHLGAEIYAQADMDLSHKISTYNDNKKYFLVEFPMQGIPKFAVDRFFEIIMEGMVPIIAHPERNAGVIRNPMRALEFVQRGARLQMNAGSLLGRHGSHVRDTAMILMNSNLIHFCGSDAHNTSSRPMKLRDTLYAVAEGWGEERARTLFKINPQKALAGEAIIAPDPLPIQPLKTGLFGKIAKMFG
ncbi:MAG TPA: CpsB/CapC family capsule biosynthesis tyrosine phosphatase [bacterium]